MSNDIALSLENVSYTYPGNHQPTLQIPKWELNRGDRFFIHGPSGSGKSTLLNLISGIITPSKGTLSLLRQDLTKLTNSQRDQFRGKHIGYIFQSFNLISYLNIRENIQLPFKIMGSPEAPLEDVKNLLKRMNLEHAIEKTVGTLSHGQKQRVAAARALIHKPEIIICDEATSALDEDNTKIFMEILMEECESQKTTLLFVGHDLRLKKYFSHSLLLSDLNQAPQS